MSWILISDSWNPSATHFHETVSWDPVPWLADPQNFFRHQAPSSAVDLAPFGKFPPAGRSRIGCFSLWAPRFLVCRFFNPWVFLLSYFYRKALLWVVDLTFPGSIFVCLLPCYLFHGLGDCWVIEVYVDKYNHNIYISGLPQIIVVLGSFH